jgi:8-oxo-dGTP pyrophosphatase MutT (NUDIX family)
MPEVRVVPVKTLDLHFVPHPWPFAEERRAEIETLFASLKREKPKLFNGRVMMLRRFDLDDDAIRSEAFETDYAAMTAWHRWDQPDTSVRNFFGLAALRASDGGYLLAVMGAHTANAGHIYFPTGTPDRKDLFGGVIDLDRSVLRELKEETGLTADDVRVLPGWHAVFFRQRVALMKSLTIDAPAAQVRERILDFLKSEAEPELADIRVVHGPADLDPAMPPFVTAFLEHQWLSG